MGMASTQLIPVRPCPSLSIGTFGQYCLGFNFVTVQGKKSRNDQINVKSLNRKRNGVGSLNASHLVTLLCGGPER